VALFGKCAEPLLCGIGGGNVAKVFDGIGDAAPIVEIDLPHEGGTPKAHRSLGFRRELTGQSKRFALDLAIRHNAIDEAQRRGLAGAE